MANKKLIHSMSIIERALGIIEGISFGVDNAIGTALIDAVEMIEHAVKEILEDGNET